jgi:hypothetical protein
MAYRLTADVEALAGDPPSPVTRGGEAPRTPISA